MNDEYRQLADIASEIEDELKSQHSENIKEWVNSPFKWVKGSIKSTGDVGVRIISRFLQMKEEFSVSDAPGKANNIKINGKTVQIKFATLGEKGYYQFNQVQDGEYEILLYFGVSPEDAHGWVACKSVVIQKWNNLTEQHGKTKRQISFKPSSCPHSWLKPQDGNLAGMCEKLLELTKRK